MNEARFWEMVRELMRLDQSQSEALYERMWVLDWELLVSKYYGD